MTDAPNGAVTVVVSPRDSFSQSLRCLDRLLEFTPSPHRIVYVDGGSPDPIARALATRARDADFALLRSDCLLTPNRARNLGLELVRSETEPAWTAFVDNDSYVEPGWVEALRACGEETGAAAVVPLLCIGEPERRRIHVAGGDSAIVRDRGVRRFEESHPFLNEPVMPARDGMSRRPCGLFEFHAVLVRTERLRQETPLDEELRSLLEHIDLGLLIQEHGGSIWFEPSVAVTYIPTAPIRGDDRRFFLVRWSDEWNASTGVRFCEKWQLAADDPKVLQNVEFGAWLRSRAYLPYRSPFVKLAGRRGRSPRTVIDRIAQRRALRRYRRGVATSGPPRLVHRPSWLGTPVDA
jgi:glycosyltransferase involved in cell wall biosynthesis